MRSGLSAEVATPYAEALMGLAKAQNLTDRVGEDMRGLLAALKQSQELTQFLGNPLIKLDDKKAVTRRLLEGKVHAYTLNFLMLLIDKRRIVFLAGVCEEYLTLLRQLNQTVLASVTSAIELTGSQKDAVKEKVIAMTGARAVELETNLDPDILGGAIVKVGSQVVDASLRGQLRRLALSLAVSA